MESLADGMRFSPALNFSGGIISETAHPPSLRAKFQQKALVRRGQLGLIDGVRNVQDGVGLQVDDLGSRHALALGEPLWRRGLTPFSPTDPAVRQPIQGELERWRALGLERELIRQAERLEQSGVPLPLDPREQAAWFSLDPGTGLRLRLEPGDPCPAGRWLSPGAALRPLMQSLLLPDLAAVVLGPAERAYWRLTEPLWERVGLAPPRIVCRPSVYVLPPGLALDEGQLEALRRGRGSRWCRRGFRQFEHDQR